MKNLHGEACKSKTQEGLMFETESESESKKNSVSQFESDQA